MQRVGNSSTESIGGVKYVLESETLTYLNSNRDFFSSRKIESAKEVISRAGFHLR